VFDWKGLITTLRIVTMILFVGINTGLQSSIVVLHLNMSALEENITVTN
jgi:hypothetical protein